MEFNALIRAEDRLSDFGVSAIFHKSQQKMAEWHCGDFYALPKIQPERGTWEKEI